MNWTDDSWSRQENASSSSTHPSWPPIHQDFEQLWKAETVEETGRVDPSRVDVNGVEVRAWFTPTYGEDLSHRIANAIERASRRVQICSPVLTAAPVISTLAQRISEETSTWPAASTRRRSTASSTTGTGTATLQVEDPHSRASARGALLGQDVRALRGPASATSCTKVTVADDVVFTGSFNLSRRGEKNAENMLEIHDAELAERLAQFVDDVRALSPLHAPGRLLLLLRPGRRAWRGTRFPNEPPP